jgi:hypothetical protein
MGAAVASNIEARRLPGANAKKIPEIDIDEDEVTLKGTKAG